MLVKESSKSGINGPVSKDNGIKYTKRLEILIKLKL